MTGNFKNDILNASFTDRETTMSTYGEYCEYMYNIHVDVGKLPSAFLANIIINAVYLVVTILGNSAVLYAILKTPLLYSPSVVLLAGLAVSDLGVGLVVQPLYLAMRVLDLQGFFNCSLATVFDITSYFLCSMSFLTVSAISAERYLALRLHLRYSTYVTIKRVSRFLVVLCLISLVVCTSKLWNKLAFVVLVIIFILGCLLVSSVAYYKIYRIVCHHKASIRSQVKPAEKQTGAHDNEKSGHITRNKKSAVSMFYVNCLMLICYTPFLCSRAIIGTTTRTSTKQAIFEFTVTFVYMNSLLNPLMYCWRLRNVRIAVIRTFRPSFLKESENSDVVLRTCRDRTEGRGVDYEKASEVKLPTDLERLQTCSIQNKICSDEGSLSHPSRTS